MQAVTFVRDWCLRTISNIIATIAALAFRTYGAATAFIRHGDLRHRGAHRLKARLVLTVHLLAAHDRTTVRMLACPAEPKVSPMLAC